MTLITHKEMINMTTTTILLLLVGVVMCIALLQRSRLTILRLLKRRTYEAGTC